MEDRTDMEGCAIDGARRDGGDGAAAASTLRTCNRDLAVMRTVRPASKGQETAWRVPLSDFLGRQEPPR